MAVLPSPGYGRFDQLVGLVEMAERLAIAPDLDSVLEVVADALMQTIELQACTIELINHDDAVPTIALTRQMDEGAIGWWTNSELRLRPLATAPAVLKPVGATPLASSLEVIRVPLVVPGQAPVGSLTLFVPAAEQVLAHNATTLRTIALQAAAAVTAARARLREVLAVYSMAQSIDGRVDLPRLATDLLGSVATLFATDHCAVVLLADGQGPTIPSIVGSLAPELSEEQVTGLQAVVQERALPTILQSWAPPQPATGSMVGLALVAPMRLERRLFGLLILKFAEARPVRQTDLWLLSAVASQMTMALRNTQLYLWSEERAIAEERTRIAREIHDGLAQSLGLKIIKIGICQRLINVDHDRLQRELDELRQSISSDIRDVRHSILSLRPIELESQGLDEAIRRYVTQYRYDTGIEVACQIDTCGSTDDVSPKTQTAAFRVVQEALNNVRKHAGSETARVTLRHDCDGLITVIVTDSGRGFAVREVMTRQSTSSGVGLRGMLERVSLAGGTIAIESAPGRGSRIVVRLPSR